MQPSVALQRHRAEIRRIAEAHHTRNARVFGSALHGSDTETSDLDLLVNPTPNTTLFDVAALRHELFQLLGIRVDVLTPMALPPTFRAAVLAEAQPL